jgi:hypothetical protein
MKQIKTIASAVFALACTISLAGCPANNNNANDPNRAYLANVPSSQQCRQGNSTYGSNWNQYSNAGFQPYGNTGNTYGNTNNSYGGGYGNQSAGCGPGFMTICDGRFGLICAPSNQYSNIAWYGYGSSSLQFYGYGYGSYGYNSYGSGYGNSGYSYGWPSYPGYSSYNVGYAAGIGTDGFYFGRTCSVGINSCGSGKFCEPTTWSSPIGVCVKN